jgi:hypothetical protein
MCLLHGRTKMHEIIDEGGVSLRDVVFGNYVVCLGRHNVSCISSFRLEVGTLKMETGGFSGT